MSEGRRSSCGFLLSDGAPGPWHEFIDAAVGPSFGDLLDDAADVGEGCDAVQFASFDDGVDCRCSFATLQTELLFRMLDGVNPELNSKAVPVDTMTGYYIKKALEALEGRADAPNEQIAAREYSFLPLLEFGERSLRVHHLMAHDPVFYHQILRDVFRGESENEISG